MQILAQLIDDHEALSGATKNLIALVSQEQSCATTAHDQLSAFRDLLHTHLQAEADFIYADELRKDPSRLDNEVTAFEQEFSDLKRDWGRYLVKWSKDNIAADRSKFSDETVRMMGRLLERIEAENAVLYPLALQHGRIRLRAA